MQQRSRRSIAAIGAFAAVAALAPSAAVADDPAATPTEAQPTPVDDPGPIDGTYDVDTGIAGSGRYVVELAGAPVAADMARQELRGRELPEAVKQRRSVQIRDRQRGIERAVEARGARVEADYQHAINGLRVEADPRTAAELEQLPGVVAVHPVELMVPDHADSLPLLGVPEVWDRIDETGEGVSVGIIDSGIDYTHAMFAGEGTAEAYERELADETFEPTARVVGGEDFVGNDYDAADPENDVPDPTGDPIDCGGHGTHVAGTTGGGGVLADGTAYDGPYDATTLSEQDFGVAPGVAPAVDLYALKVFGCAGSTAVTVDAIEWAVENDLDVINMSLGSLFGRPDGATTVASDNAAEAGILVVASAGNSGSVPYIGGSPASSTRTISVAANDAIPAFPAATLTLDGSEEVEAIVANEAEVPDDASWDVHVLGGDPTGPSLGCEESQWQAEAAEVAGSIVITERGVCARVDRVVFGERAGAAAVVMIDDSPNLPPLEGPVRDPGSGEVVQIPFLGVRGGDGPPVAAATTIAAEGFILDNPNHTGLAGFTSMGPRGADAALKPDVTAPGVGVLSADVGTGDGGMRMSGTSMSAPHVTGVAAIAAQANPDWDHDALRAVITSTADASPIGGTAPFTVRQGGAGLVQPTSIVDATTVAHGDEGTSSLSFGVAEVATTWTESRDITLENLGDEDVSYEVSAGAANGSQPHRATVDGTVTVPAGGSATVEVTVDVSADDIDAGPLGLGFVDVSGLVSFTPTAGPDVGLSVPYLAITAPRAEVDIERQERFTPNPTNVTPVEVTNDSDRLATVHPFSWGASSADGGLSENDLRSVGVRNGGATLGGTPVETLEFAVSMHRPWSTASTLEVQVPVDTTGDGQANYLVLGIDIGLITTGTFTGDVVAAIVDLDAGGTLSAFFNAVAPEDNHTMILPVPRSALGLDDGGAFRYGAAAFDLLSGAGDEIGAWSAFDTDRPAVDAPVTVVPAGGTVVIDVRTDGRPIRGGRSEGVLFIVPQAPVGDQAVTFSTPTRGS